MTETLPPFETDDPDWDSLIAYAETQHPGTVGEAELLVRQTQRELRLLRAKHDARLRFDEEQAAVTDETRAAPLDWADFLGRDLTDIEWLPGKLLAKGQQATLVGDGKAGKSLLCLEWAWRTAAGLPFLGDEAREPVRVLYVDQENSHDVIQDRLNALGADADTLANLAYLSFPAFRPLSTAGGGGDLMRAIERHGSELVFLDTISRMIAGKENESDPWLDLYRYTLKPLKAARCASVRLDHFGKDQDRGARGSSAKTQDVDQVWELTSADDGLLKLKRTHTRTGIGPGFLAVRRLGEKDGDRWRAGETRHVLAASDGVEAPDVKWIGVQALAAELDRLGVPLNWGRGQIRKAHPTLRYRNEMFAEAQDYRRSGDRLVA